MTLAFLFPGQGAQIPGFLHRLPDRASVRETLAEASDVLDSDVLELDGAEALRSTVAVQLALTIAGVAASRTLVGEGLEPRFHAGMSVGAYAAAVGCGAVGFEDALRLVRRRAQLMENARPHGYGLAAVLGLNEVQIGRLVDAHLRDGHGAVYVANVNAPRQIVMAGADADLQAFAARAVTAGARRAQRLDVAVPSHCELLADAAAELAAWARGIPFRKPHGIYASNRGGRPLSDGEAIRDDLVNNMRSTVRWFDAMAMMGESGATVFIEAPPGQVLTDLAREILPDCTALSASAMEPDRLAAVAGRKLLS